MNEHERHAFDKLRDIPEDHDDEEIYIADVLDGSTPLDISHAGGEFVELLEEDLRKEQVYVSFITF
jgi:hypothetical protein